MRLLVTGLCVRAARNAQLLSLVRHRTLLVQPTCLSRSSSSQVVKQAEDPWQSTAAHSDQFAPQGQEANSKRETAQTSQGQNDGTKEAGGGGQRISRDSLGEGITVLDHTYQFDENSNLSPSVTNLIDRRLYDTPNHPLCITRKLIESVFPRPTFANHVAYNPVVTTEQNFDVLGFPKDHPGRSRTDTYYVDSKHVLRTHTSAHQLNAFKYMATHPEVGYTICADVYRRDSIDRSHFPVFHQMEGARLWPYIVDKAGKSYKHELHNKRVDWIQKNIRALPSPDLDVVKGDGDAAFDLARNPPQPAHSPDEVRVMVRHLKKSLENLVYKVFTEARKAGLGDEAIGKDEKLKVRWVEAYFPFTSPSFELEVFWQGEWLELLGCGIVQQKLLNAAGLNDRIGWAWGIGIERLAMLLFGVPDIRLFWSEDPRFLSQFSAGKITKYEAFSKYPACYKDVAFWIDASPAAALAIGVEPSGGVAAAAGGDATKASPAETQPAAFHENDVMEIVRDVAGSLAEDVRLVDDFVHPTSGRKSLCYRINYRSLERTLTNEEVNEMHQKVVGRLGAELKIEMR